MAKIINGIQQIGIGVRDANGVFNWYRKYLGFDILVFRDEAIASLMTRYTGDRPENRYALLAMNMIGGGGLEIWQFKNRIPEPPKTKLRLGDLGINVMKIRANNLKKPHEELQKQKLESITDIGGISKSGTHFFCTDPWNNLIQVVEDDYSYCPAKSNTGGVLGIMLGVSDINDSLRFYGKLLGFDSIVYDRKGIFSDFLRLPGGESTFRRVLLERSEKIKGGFGKLYGPSQIELLQVLDRPPQPIFKNRLWGDLGYIHLCFDISGMAELRKEAKAMNHEFTVDSTNSFDMGDAAGHFSYLEDPDGTLIEFVETHKVPIFKKFGLYFNLKKRNPEKPLPKWMVKLMQIHRVDIDL